MHDNAVRPVLQVKISKSKVDESDHTPQPNRKFSIRIFLQNLMNLSDRSSRTDRLVLERLCRGLRRISPSGLFRISNPHCRSAFFLRENPENFDLASRSDNSPWITMDRQTTIAFLQNHPTIGG